MPELPFDGSFDLDKYQSFLHSTLKAMQNDNGVICRGCPHIIDFDQPAMYPSQSNLFHEPSSILPIKLERIAISHFTSCNARCCYCNVWQHPIKTPYAILPILKQFHSTGMFANNAVFDWGGGECTLYPEFEEVATWIADQGYRQCILTNAIRFSPTIFSLLERNVVGITRISLDSGSRSVYKDVKGVDKFDVVCENIQRYVKAAKHPHAVVLKFIILEEVDNQCDIGKFLELCKSFGIVNVENSLDSRIMPVKIQEKSLAAYTLFEEMAKKYNLSCTEAYVCTADMKTKIENYRKLHLKTLEKISMKQCPYLTTYIFFGRHGILHPCCEPSIKLPSFPFGSDDIDIDNYTSFLKNTLKSLQHDNAEICGGCPQKVDLDPDLVCRDSSVEQMPPLALPIKLKTIGISHFNSCNSRCCYCNAWTLPNKKINILKIFKQLHGAGMFASNACFVWGGGECSILPAFEETATWIFDQGYQQMIATNAIRFSPAIATLLEYDAIKNIMISIDCGSPELYKRIKGVDQYDTVCENIKRYIKISKYKSTIQLKFVILEVVDNSCDIDNFFDLCKYFGITNVCYSVDYRINPENIQQKTLESALYFESTAKRYNLNCAAINTSAAVMTKIENYRKLHTAPVVSPISTAPVAAPEGHSLPNGPHPRNAFGKPRDLPYTEKELPRAVTSSNFARAQHVRIATSICPDRTVERQIAVNSWLLQGFRVFSLNTPDEIALLQPNFPYVTFVQVMADAASCMRKKSSTVNELLNFLLESGQAGDVLGIMNSDLVLCQLDLDKLFAYASRGLVFSDSIEYPSCLLSDTGFGAFFFTKSCLPENCAALDEFSLAESLWGHVLPLAFTGGNKHILRACRPFAMHYTRNLPWDVEERRRQEAKFRRIFQHTVLHENAHKISSDTTAGNGISVDVGQDETLRAVEQAYVDLVLNKQQIVDVLDYTSIQ